MGDGLRVRGKEMSANSGRNTENNSEIKKNIGNKEIEE